MRVWRVFSMGVLALCVSCNEPKGEPDEYGRLPLPPEPAARPQQDDVCDGFAKTRHLAKFTFGLGPGYNLPGIEGAPVDLALPIEYLDRPARVDIADGKADVAIGYTFRVSDYAPYEVKRRKWGDRKTPRPYASVLIKAPLSDFGPRMAQFQLESEKESDIKNTRGRVYSKDTLGTDLGPEEYPGLYQIKLSPLNRLNPDKVFVSFSGKTITDIIYCNIRFDKTLYCRHRFASNSVPVSFSLLYDGGWLPEWQRIREDSEYFIQCAMDRF